MVNANKVTEVRNEQELRRKRGFVKKRMENDGLYNSNCSTKYAVYELHDTELRRDCQIRCFPCSGYTTVPVVFVC